MKEEDFHKGQTVWVYLTENTASGKNTTEERIQEWEVVSAGRKYVTARPKGSGPEFNISFEIENGSQQSYKYFRQSYGYVRSNYILHLSREDAWRTQTREYIKRCARWGSPIPDIMSDEDLQTVSEIFKKYDKESEKK